MVLDELISKQLIAENLYRYCRSLDRMDKELYDSLFMPEATLEYSEYFTGTAQEFRDWVWAIHESMYAHSHQITNILIEVNPDRNSAVSESYVTVCLASPSSAEGHIRNTI